MMTKKALVHGTRICQIEDAEFPVSTDLSWVDVADNTTTADSYVDGKVVTYVEPTPTVNQARRAGYGSVEDQLDQLFHDMSSDKGDKSGDWYAAISKVKTDFPKPK